MKRFEIERTWRENKYFVLSKSNKLYLEIREYLKNENASIVVLNNMIEQAYSIAEDKKQVVNSLEHIWGYFKKSTNEIEKNKFFEILELYNEEKISIVEPFLYLKKLLEKYPNKYLEESNIFQIYLSIL